MRTFGTTLVSDFFLLDLWQIISFQMLTTTAMWFSLASLFQQFLDYVCIQRLKNGHQQHIHIGFICKFHNEYINDGDNILFSSIVIMYQPFGMQKCLVTGLLKHNNYNSNSVCGAVLQILPTVSLSYNDHSEYINISCSQQEAHENPYKYGSYGNGSMWYVYTISAVSMANLYVYARKPL